MQDLITFGSSVKALGEGKIGGHLVLYGSPQTPDLSPHKDFFTASTEYDIEAGDRRGLYWCHGQDPKIGIKKIGTLTVTPDDLGLWVEGILNMADEYQRSIYDLAEKGKLGFSSGAPSHLVARKAIETKSGTVHEITHWPIAEGSLTPTPADYRNVSYTIKSLAASLPSLIDADADTEPPATKGRTDFTYDDMRALLESEWNEDFGPGILTGCDTWERQWHIISMNDATCVAQQGWDGELIQRAYTVTDGNDVVWGDPQEVARTTSFVTVTDGDDPPMMAGKTVVTGTVDLSSQTDVAALKAMLRGSMTLDDHAAIVQDAMAGFATRAEGLVDTATKAGRAMSASRHAKLKAAHTAMSAHMQAMAGHLDAINEMLTSTDPDAKKEIEDFAALRGRFVRLQSELLHMSG